MRERALACLAGSHIVPSSISVSRRQSRAPASRSLLPSVSTKAGAGGDPGAKKRPWRVDVDATPLEVVCVWLPSSSAQDHEPIVTSGVWRSGPPKG